MTIDPEWSSPLMWRVAAALDALRREIENSRAIVEASVMARLDREWNGLEQRRKRLVGDARRITDAPEGAADALTQGIMQFYRDVGELERCVASQAAGGREPSAHQT